MARIRFGWSVAMIVILVVGMVGIASPGVATTGPAMAVDDDNSSTDPLGSQISSFMQANAAHADGTVESGMWAQRASDEDDVQIRARGLEQRLDRLEAELDALQRAYEDDEIPEVVYKAQANRLLGQYLGIQTAIQRTSSVAERIGADPMALQPVKDRSAQSKQGFQGIARGLPGDELPPGLQDRDTPPGHADDHPGGPQNGAQGSDDERGQGPQESGSQDDDRDRGPPDHANASATDDRGPPEMSDRG